MRIGSEERNIIVVAFIAVTITILVIIFSEAAFNAAFDGLQVWWEIVFPSLLPFFIIAEILMGLGVVNFLGALLEPLMRPLFKVPGVGAFAMAMGIASGYPIGAKLTAKLRRQNMCTKTEAERLVSFTNTADPLFMVGAVAVGMFGRPDLAIIIAGSHYVSCVLIGIIMRFYPGEEGKEKGKKIKTDNSDNNMNIFKKAIYELIEARKDDGRGLGELMGDAVRESINTLLMIGGFIVLFSVVTKILEVTGFIEIITTGLMFVLEPFGLSSSMTLPLISGIFEITNGTNIAAQAQAPLIEKLVICNIIIAWSGISVHGQVATMIKDTDINIKPYILARILQSLLAGISTIFFLIPLSERVMPAFQPTFFAEKITLSNIILSVSLLALFIIISGIIVSLILHFLKKIKIIIFHT